MKRSKSKAKNGSAQVENAVKEKQVPPAASSSSPAAAADDLRQVASDPALSEDVALSLLNRPDLPPEIIEHLAKNIAALKSRRVKIALVSHPRTPRHVSVPLARQFYTFDLMKVALSTGVPADVKIAIDDTLISRLQTVTIGERLSLARRASGRVAAALLLDDSMGDAKITDKKNARPASPTELGARVVHAALENPRLTEALVISSVLRPSANATLIERVAHHPKWGVRREVRAALLRTEYLSLARALEFSREIPTRLLPELLSSSRLPENIKSQLLCEHDPGLVWSERAQP